MENSETIDLLSDAFDDMQIPEEFTGELVSSESMDVVVRDGETVIDALNRAGQPESTNPWDPRLILDLAIGVDGLDEILPRYELAEEEFLILSGTKAFRRELAITMRDVRENGIPFTQKAKVQAESYLEIIDDLVYNNATPANTRLEAIRSMVKWGKLEPQKEAKDDALNATQINVNISF